MERNDPETRRSTTRRPRLGWAWFAGADARVLGLVPSERSSGEQRRVGRITKTGNARARYLLVEAAWRILRSKSADTAALRAWALTIAARRGKRIAVVALARRLAGILYAMWRDGHAYDATKLRMPRAPREAPSA